MDVQNSTLFNFAQSFGFSSVPDSQPPHLADSFRKAKEMNADFILSEISRTNDFGPSNDESKNVSELCDSD